MYKHKNLAKVASWVSNLAGHPVTFVAMAVFTITWFILWIFLGFSGDWLNLFSIFSMILGFQLLFIIKHTQDRESTVIEIKLNELIRTSKGAHNALLDLEKLTGQDFDFIQSGYADIAAAARKELSEGRTEFDTAVVEVRSLTCLIDPQDILRDPERLETLKTLKLVDTPPEETFDRLTKLAKRTLGVPVALLSIVTHEKQFFKSCAGLTPPYSETRQTPLSHSFCQHVVVSGEPLVINDARLNPIVRENLAIRDLNVIAYCGIPLVTQDNRRLGSFCAIDTKPRFWKKDELEFLTDLAAIAMERIQQRKG